MEIQLKDGKISRKLYDKHNITLKITVPLEREDYRKEKKTYHSVYTSKDDVNYITVDIEPFLILEMKDGTPWDKKKSILVTDDNIQALIDGFEKIINNMIYGKVFGQLENGDSIVFKDKVEENTVHISNLLGSQYVELRPGIYVDEQDDLTYECCLMYFNKRSNVIPLTVDTLAALYRKLKQIDIFMYSQALLNYYVATKDKIELPKKEPKKKGNVFTAPAVDKQESTMTSSLPANNVSKQSGEDFFGINNTK